MKKFFLTASILMASVTAFSQQEAGKLNVIPKVGLNVATLSGPEKTSPRVGLVIGAELEYQLTQLIGFSAGAFYSMQGAKNKESFSEELPTYSLRVENDVTSKYDYINIPLMLNANVLKGLTLKAGIQPSFNVVSENDGDVTVTRKNETKTYSYKDYIARDGDLESIDSDAKAFYLSIPVGASYEYNNFVFDARYNIGLTDLSKYSKSKHNVFQLMIGYKFSLK